MTTTRTAQAATRTAAGQLTTRCPPRRRIGALVLAASLLAGSGLATAQQPLRDELWRGRALPQQQLAQADANQGPQQPADRRTAREREQQAPRELTTRELIVREQAAREQAARDQARARDAGPQPDRNRGGPRSAVRQPDAPAPAQPMGPARPVMPMPQADAADRPDKPHRPDHGPGSRPPVVVVQPAPPAVVVRDERGWRDGPDRHDRRDGPDWRDGRSDFHRPRVLPPGLGTVLRVVPPGAHLHTWRGAPYHYREGVWYSPHRHGYVVVRPPFGLVVRDLPFWRTMVVVGGISYLLANDIYYREQADGYQVVPPPSTLVNANVPAGDSGDALLRQYVYPNLNQSPEQQASDEYECHRWAVEQTGFDPTSTALGNSNRDISRRDDYLRARAACLDGRGYTVR